MLQFLNTGALMIVYIEYVLIDNFVIDYLMLKATFTTTGKRYKKGRLFLCAFLGAIIALVFPLIKVHSVILIAIKVLSGILIILISNDYQKKKDFYVHALLFFGYTFLTGGVIIGVFNILGLNYSSEISIALMVIPVYFVLSACIHVIKFIYRRKDVLRAVYDVEILAYGIVLKGRGFLDTGNGLFDGDNPVIFCEKGFAKRFFDGHLGQIKLKKITVNTVNGSAQKIAFQIDEIKIYIDGKPNIHNNVTVCVVEQTGEGYDVILHPALFRRKIDETHRKIKKIS